MNPSKRTIPLDQAGPGMVLAEAVSQNGSVLLPAGTELAASHLASLSRRDVTEICIVAPPSAEDAARDEAARQAQREAVTREVQHLFRKSEQDAATQALIATVLDYRLEKAS